MKCEDCLVQIEDYVDGELETRHAEMMDAHLAACAACSEAFDALHQEQQLYARYTRDVAITPAIWQGIEASISRGKVIEEQRPKRSFRERLAGLFVLPNINPAFASAMAVVIVAVIIGALYLSFRKTGPTGGVAINETPKPIPSAKSEPPVTATTNGGGQISEREVKQTKPEIGIINIVAKDTNKPLRVEKSVVRDVNVTGSPSDKSVEDSPLAELAMAEPQDAVDIEANRHIEKAELLLRTMRNVQISDSAQVVDIAYEKKLSQKLLDENVSLRLDAENAGKVPTKELLSTLEPFLREIANMQEKSSPNDVRAIKDRMEKTEIVAALQAR